MNDKFTFGEAITEEEVEEEEEKRGQHGRKLQTSRS